MQSIKASDGGIALVLQEMQVLFTGHREHGFHGLFEEYLSGKQTLVQLAQKHDVSVSTIQRRLRTIHSTRIISKDKDVVVLMNTTYQGGVLLYDCYRKKLLWRKFMDRKEIVADYIEGIEWLEQHHFKIYGIVCYRKYPVTDSER